MAQNLLSRMELSHMGLGFGHRMAHLVAPLLIWTTAAALLVSCSQKSGNVPTMARGIVEVPTAIRGVLETDGYCYRLRLTDSARTIAWVEGTRLGQDARGHYVVDIAGQKRYSGDIVGLSGGPAIAEELDKAPKFTRYLQTCGRDLITGLRFSGE